MPRHTIPKALVVAGTLSLALAARAAQDKAEAPRPPAGGGAGAKAEATEQAKAALKEMSTALAAAETLRFKVRSLIPMKDSSGEWITLIGGATVQRQGKDKLSVETGGDLFPFHLYFDGKTVTAYAQKENVYAKKEVSGTIDDMLARSARSGEATFVFADLVSADPYASMTRGLKSARVVGSSVVDDVETQHLAVHGQLLDWEIWIGTKDRLPRMVTLTDVSEASKPTQTLLLSEWARDERLPEDAFSFQAPSGATEVPFRSPEQRKGAAAARRGAPAARR